MTFPWQETKSPIIMGILNITPDSFSDGGEYVKIDKALSHISTLIKEGAAIIDIGAESSRPGAQAISAQEEERRLRPLLEALPQGLKALISVDTYKPTIAQMALELGATIINDIHGIDINSEMAEAVLKHNAAWVIMDYKAIKSVKEAVSRMALALTKAQNLGLAASQLISDPGLGFNKHGADNIALTKAIPHYKELNVPLLYGPSRKRFLGEISGETDPARRDAATATVCAIAAAWGADIFRVHNVAAVAAALKIGAAFYQKSNQITDKD